MSKKGEEIVEAVEPVTPTREVVSEKVPVVAFAESVEEHTLPPPPPD